MKIIWGELKGRVYILHYLENVDTTLFSVFLLLADLTEEETHQRMDIPKKPQPHVDRHLERLRLCGNVDFQFWNRVMDSVEEPKGISIFYGPFRLVTLRYLDIKVHFEGIQY